MTAISAADKIRLGSKTVSAAYLGSVKVWPPVWTPAKLPGLAAWIDPAQDKAAGRFTDGQAITGYTSYDSSGRAFAAGGAPKFRSAAVGGKPRIEFDWTRSDALSCTGYVPGPAGLTFVLVAQSPFATTYGMMLTYATDDPAHGYEIRNSDSSMAVQVIGDYQSGGPAVSSPFVRSPNVDYAIIMRVDMGEQKIRLWINDTAQLVVNSVAAMPTVPNSIRIGHRAPGGYFWSGLIAEAMVISGPISDADRVKLMAYIRSKHGALPPV